MEDITYRQLLQKLEMKLYLECKEHGAATDEAIRLLEVIKNLQLAFLEVAN